LYNFQQFGGTKAIKYFLVIIALTITTFAQVEDSVSISLESLLGADIEAIKVVESASKYSQSPEDAPSSVSIITSKEIEIYGYKTLVELLNSQVGFYISNDRNYNYLGVRGFSRQSDYNNRILLLIDGHRINEYVYDGALLGTQLGLSLDNFEKVEIIRGPGSALYGTSAMFAVINLIPKKLHNILNPEVKLAYGSFNTKSFSINSGHQFDNDILFSLNMTYAESDGEDLHFAEFNDPETNNGLAEGRDFMKRHGIMGSFSYKNFTLHGISTYSLDAVPTAPY
jgi:outer membrane cobalamin receptor